MLKLVMMPPQNDFQRQWAPRLQRSLPDYSVVVPETEAETRHELLDADAAYGWVPPDMLPAATKLRWLQNPQAGPAPGYYYPALIAHPVVVGNPRGIYFDHISHHILISVAERSFPLLNLVEMLCPPRSQSLLYGWRQVQDHLDKAQGFKDFKVTP